MNSFSSLFIWRWWEPHILLYCDLEESFCLSRLVSYKLDIYCTHFTVVIINIDFSQTAFSAVHGGMLWSDYGYGFPQKWFIQYNSIGSIEEFALKHAAYSSVMVVPCIIKWKTNYLLCAMLLFCSDLIEMSFFFYQQSHVENMECI